MSYICCVPYKIQCSRQHEKLKSSKLNRVLNVVLVFNNEFILNTTTMIKNIPITPINPTCVFKYFYCLFFKLIQWTEYVMVCNSIKNIYTNTVFMLTFYKLRRYDCTSLSRYQPVDRAMHLRYKKKAGGKLCQPTCEYQNNLNYTLGAQGI